MLIEYVKPEDCIFKSWKSEWLTFDKDAQFRRTIGIRLPFIGMIRIVLDECQCVQCSMEREHIAFWVDNGDDDLSFEEDEI